MLLLPSAPAKVLASKNASLVLLPAVQTVNVGSSFNIAIQIQANGEQVAGTSVFLNFDASKLAVNSLDAKETWNGKTVTYFGNGFDNDSGTVDITGVPLGETITGTFTVATVTFFAKATITSTSISFHFDHVGDNRHTQMQDVDTNSVLGTATGATITITGSSGTGTGTGGTGTGTGTGSTPTVTTVNTPGLSAVSPLQVDQTGKVQAASLLTTADQKVSLNIAKDTKLTDAQGNAITSLTAVVVSAPPAPPAGETILSSYDLGPDGTLLDPPIALTMTYTVASLPAAANEADLYIAWWDGAKWVPLPSAVDTRAKTVTAQISHFTQFAAVSAPPAPASTPTPTQTQTTNPPLTQTPPATSTPTTPAPGASTTPVTSPSSPAPPRPAMPEAPAQERPSRNWWLIGGIFAGVAIVVLISFILLRSRTRA